MNHKLKNIMLVGFTSIFFVGCALQKKAPQPKLNQFAQAKFIDVFKIPNKLFFQNTRVGGLSSIDYNAEKDEYYFICDDRSALNPARYYTAKIKINYPEIQSIEFIKVDTLKDESGKPFQNFEYFKNHPNETFNTPDPEELRFNANTQQMIWSSEGERIIGAKNILLNPSIQVIEPNGQFVKQFPIPTQVQMSVKEFGPRRNGVLEGLSFANNYQTLFVSLEEPLFQDGPPASFQSQETWCRILKYQVNESKLLAQYAYPLGNVIRKSIPPNAFKINGVSSILALDENRLLVVERSFSMGHLQSNVRVYLCDLSQATDIQHIEGLANQTTSFTAANKQLLINFDTLGVYIDNVEGITFGPKLPNGHQTLLFVTDHNFQKLEKQQVFLFELIP